MNIKVQFHPPALERMLERGATEKEVVKLFGMGNNSRQNMVAPDSAETFHARANGADVILAPSKLKSLL